MTTILVVEDEEPIRMLWHRFLANWGFEALLAENGQVGLETARRETVPLVITDLTMPVLSGQEMLRTIKEEQPDTEIIVTTGNGTVEVAVEMMKAGAYDFLTKPINFDHAELVIHNCLERIAAKAETQRLRQENRDLEELNELKEKFIAITSHELRTPVSVINNVTEMLGPELAGKSGENLFRLITNASGQLNEIVAQMHELSGINSTKMKVQIEQFQLPALCREVKEEIGWVLEKRKQAVRVELPSEFPVKADRAKFKKVVRELLQNAIKFTQDGGTITFSAAMEEGGVLQFTVSDSGIGIPPQELEKIFHLFYEVGNSLHHHSSKEDFLGGGMGVGLAMVQDIVHAHGGRVEVESTVNEGSRFTVFLPQEISP